MAEDTTITAERPPQETPPEPWPPALRQALDLCRASPAPMVVWAGRQPDALVAHPNDAARGLDAAALAEALAPGLTGALRGEAVSLPNQPLGGRVINAALSPIRDEDGAAVGVLAVLSGGASDAALAQRLAFEIRAADALRGLGDPDAVQHTAARLLGAHLEADRCGFGMVDEARRVFRIDHEWRRAETVRSYEGVWPIDGGGMGAALLEQCRGREVVRMTLRRDGSRGAPADADPEAPCHGLLMPLLREDDVIGLLYALTSTPRRWSEDDAQTLRIVAERAAVALERTQAERRLQESEARLALATRASGQGVWDITSESGEAMLSPKAREIWGFAPDERISRDDLFARMAPEDRDSPHVVPPPWRRPEGQGPVEFRVHRPDGAVRTLRLYGQLMLDPGGATPVRSVGTVEDVTDERTIQAALQHSETRLRLALEGGRMAVWGMRAGGNLEASLEFNRLLGLPDDRPLTVDDLSACYAPGEEEALAEVRARAFAARDRHVEYEFRHIWPNGEVRWMQIRAEVFWHDNPMDNTAIGVALDVTDAKRGEEQRRRIEQELRESETRLRFAQDAGQIGSFELLPAEQRLLVSESFCRLWGLPYKPEYQNAEILELIHPEDRRRLGSPRLEPGALDYREYRITRADTGEERWMARRGAAIRDVDGRDRYVGVSYDITGRKRAELAVQALNETLEAQVAARTAERDRMWRLSAELMVVGRATGAVLAANPAWEAQLGWRADEITGSDVFDLVHPDDVETARAAVAGGVAGAGTFRFESRMRARDGRYRVFAWAASAEDGLVHALGRDVTEEREAAEALRRTEEVLRQAQKMEAVGQLTGGVAHDFNNMLAIVIGSLDLAERRIGRGEDAARYLTAAREGALRGAALTQRLLAFSRRQPLSPRTVSLNRLVGDMLELLRRTLGETVTLETVLAGGLWSVNVDPNQLESALINLAVNARDAMPEGGRLTVSTANRDVDAAFAREHPGLEPGHYVTVAVADRGAGMTPDVLERVFDPFFTTKPVGKGTGLGLSMVYGFVSQSGGYVDIASTPGEGTTVLIYLPRAIDAPHEDGPAEPPAATGAAHEVVLVVEDEDEVRQMSVEALTELGYAVHAAASGEDALKLLATLPRIDLLFTDVVMPGISGPQLAAAVRAERPGTRVLYTSGYAREATSEIGGAGAELLSKPFSITELAAKARAVLDTSLG